MAGARPSSRPNRGGRGQFRRNASNSTPASNASSWSPRSLNRFHRSSTSKNPACLRIESSPIHPSQWNQKGSELARFLEASRFSQRQERGSTIVRGLVSRIHRKKPKGQTDAGAHAPCQRAEVVFAHQKGMMGLFVRTIGLARARLKIGLANLAYNMRPTCAASSGSTIDAFPRKAEAGQNGAASSEQVLYNAELICT